MKSTILRMFHLVTKIFFCNHSTKIYNFNKKCHEYYYRKLLIESITNFPSMQISLESIESNRLQTPKKFLLKMIEKEGKETD